MRVVRGGSAGQWFVESERFAGHFYLVTNANNGPDASRCTCQAKSTCKHIRLAVRTEGYVPRAVARPEVDVFNRVARRS